MKDKITVLFIEQGVAFGGSLVVIANLVRCLDQEKFRSVVVAEMDQEIVQHHVKGMAKIYIAKHNFNYETGATVALTGPRRCPPTPKSGLFHQQ